MSQRATLTYTGDENASKVDQLHVLYCRYSGRHAISTDCDLSKAPRRKTDGAIVVDTEFYTTKLYTNEGGVKYIRRQNGSVERQIRESMGRVPVGYRSELGGRFLYVFPDALSTYSGANGADKTKRPAPPSIVQTAPDCVEVNLEVEDRAPQAGIVRITRDHVKVQIMQPIANDEKSSQELLEILRTALGGRQGQLSLIKGVTTRQKILKVQGLSPEAIFEKLEENL